MDLNKSNILFRNEIAGTSMFFEHPSELLVAHSVEELIEVLHQIDIHSASGKWIAGYLSYEAGYCFEEKLKKIIPNGRKTPLACFGVFDGPSPTPQMKSPETDRSNSSFFGRPVPKWDFETYKVKFDQLAHHMRIGDCYQGNLTFPMTSEWRGDPLALFQRLSEIQPVNHAAFVNLDGPTILSRSPELFFKVGKEGWIESRPMKGTASRGATESEDQAIIEFLKNDPKNRSENVMIVDLLRNDISDVSETGTVEVPKLYEINTYETLHQMVSRVRGKLIKDTSFIDIVRALFPCGSITGVPKIRAMEILASLEDYYPREAYCGAIGWIAPTGEMQFNVPIRTISLYDDGVAEFNVGGGITLDSDASSEYQECLTKAKFATELAKLFD